MAEMLTREDVDYLMEMAGRGESWVCRSQWFTDFAARVKATLDRLEELEASQPKPEEPNYPVVVTWDLQLMYKHRAFKQPRFESLGKTNGCEHKDAIKYAENLAAIWIEQNFEEKDIEKWEVKARPAQTTT